MLKIIHLADLHFQNKQPILADIIKCSDYALSAIGMEEPDLICDAGDTLDFLASPEGIPVGSPAHMAALNFVYNCGMIAPMVIVGGTKSHDGFGALEAFSKLKTAYPIYVTERPEQIGYFNDGERQAFIAGNEFHRPCRCIISCLPTITKGNILAYTSGSTEDTTREAQDLIRDMLQAWGVVNDQARNLGVPTVLVGHCTVTGSELSTGQVMTGKDLELTTGDLTLAKADLYCLGHIHKRQFWNGNIHYCGSITRLNHGETESKSFCVHEIQDGVVSTQDIETPARVMRTLRQEGLPGLDCVQDVHEGETIRITYTIAECDVGKVDEEAIRQEAMARGAADVKIEKVIVPTVRVRAEGISQEHTLVAKFDKWAETVGETANDELYEKLDNLELREVESIIADYNGEGVERETNIAAA